MSDDRPDTSKKDHVEPTGKKRFGGYRRGHEGLDWTCREGPTNDTDGWGPDVDGLQS